MRFARASHLRVHPLWFPATTQLPLRPVSRHSSNTTMAPTATVTKVSSKTVQSRKVASQPLTPLQQQWTTLYTTTLPRLASSKSLVQGNGAWPVTIDHCFARIILDNAVGIDKPWPQAVAAPATRNMTPTQLKACVALAEKVANGHADLWELDATSMKLRGKTPKVRNNDAGSTDAESNSKKKRKAPASSADMEDQSPTAGKKSRKQEAAENWSGFSLKASKDSSVLDEEAETLPDIQHIIASSADLTQFRRDCLTLLTQVPRGRYTTYQALSDAMTALHPNMTASGGKDKSRASGCARAVGSAMRTNPFAPTVPCHRVLASDGKIGGFKGDWGKEGKFYNEKMRLLTEEGVRFDSNGKVIGQPFRGFT